ncbi:MAG: hypothetical protein FWD16_07560 [Clostridia bacterium]|nr:hypothetical protein [Clostridia bacterium]
MKKTVRILSLALLFVTVAALLAACSTTAPSQQPASSAVTSATGAPTAAPSDAVPGTASGNPVSEYYEGRDAFFAEAGGLIMTLEDWPANAEYIDCVVHRDNSYFHIDMVDALAVIRMERNRPALGVDPDVIAAHFADGEHFMPEVNQNDALTQKLSYPAWRIDYVTGQNEDTRTHVAIYVGTDEWDFIADFSVAADFYEEYEAAVQGWIDSITLKDA